jgi:hypothetical protein
MTWRYYLAPILGDGSPNNPYRPKTADLMRAALIEGSVSSSIPSDRLGHPLHAWALVSAPDVAALRDDVDHYVLPDVEIRWEDLASVAQQYWQSAFSDCFGRTLIPEPGDTVGDVLTALGKTLLDGAGFEIDQLTGG